MAVIRHAYQSATPDDPSHEVSSSEWNADHSLTGVIDIANGGTGTTSGISPGTQTALDAALKVSGNQTITGGFKVAPADLGTGAGTVTPDPFSANYQYITNNGAFTLAAPTSDCAIDILIINGATAGVITFSGFATSPTGPGDALNQTNAAKFLVSIRRIKATAFYTLKQVS
jgi:hypothetical protein